MEAVENNEISDLKRKIAVLIDFVTQMRPILDNLGVKIKQIEERVYDLEKKYNSLKI